MRVGSWPGASYRHNPMIRILCEGLAANGADVIDVAHPAEIEPGALDVLQLHWAEQVFWTSGNARERLQETLRTLTAIWRHRRAGTRVCWIVHNIRPHKMHRLSEKALWPILRRGFCALSDVLVTLSPNTAEVVERAYNLRRGSVRWIRHPRYPQGPDHEAARAALTIEPEKRLIAFFGTIRPNKGVGDLVRAFGATSDPALELRVMGKADEPQSIVRAAAGDPRVKLELEYVSREALELTASAADLVVIPLQDQLHSGSLIDALSLGAPILTSDLPFARGLQDDVGADWVRLFDGPLTASHLLTRRPVGRPDLSLYDPERVGSALMAIYREAKIEG